MRRMREFSKRYFWFAVPAGVAIIAIGAAKFMMGPTVPGVQGKKPSRYADARARELEERRKSGHSSRSAESDDVSDDPPEKPIGKQARHESAASDGHQDVGDSSVVCGSREYIGAGTAKVKVSAEHWEKVISRFHIAKQQLVSWIDTNRSVLGEKSASELAAHVKSIRIHRPPQADEPDLDWRGIGVYSRDIAGEPLIKIGGGFMKLMEQEPQRAHFELTRLLAQSWSPCELKRDGLTAAPWKPLLDCLKLPSDGDAACPNTEVSEAGWAISTAVAVALVSPGCRVPAMNDPQLAGCMARPLPPLKGEALKFKESSLHSEVR